MVDPEILKIKPEKVRLIGTDGRQIGIFNLQEAQKYAEENELDLILVNSKADPVVVRLGNYHTFIYQKEKKEKLKKKPKETKEVRISFNEAMHDLERKANVVKKFLEEKHQVQIRLMLKGRERNFPEKAEEKLNNFLNLIKEKINFDLSAPIKKSNNFLSVVLKVK